MTCGIAVFTVLLPVLAQTTSPDDTWPRFRGHNGAGVSQQQGLPVKWKDGDSSWSQQLAGTGHSSPIVWKDAVFVTSATDTARLLHRLDAASGEIRWTRTISLSRSHTHKKNSLASGTPATDGSQVYVSFSDGEKYLLAAFDFSGERVWQRDLGGYSSQHGQGSSPVLFEDKVILASDQRGPSSLQAFNRKTGKPVWKTDRESREASYSTPLIFRQRDKPAQLICVSGATGVTSLDPVSGRKNWSAGTLPMRTVASPILMGDGTVLVSCGQGGAGTYMLAIDVKSDVPEKKRVRFERNRLLPYVPTPVMVNGLTFLWTDKGIVVCTDADGKEIWKERVGGNFSGSPICVDGKLYCISERGVVVVVDATRTFRLRGKTPLGQPSHSTPAIAGGRLFLRTFDRLVCVEANRKGQ